MPGNKLFDLFSQMDGSPIPQKDHRPSKMFEQGSKKGSDIEAVKVPGLIPDIQSDALSFRGYRKGANGEHPIPFINVIKERRFPLWRPGSPNGWNEKKAAFIKKGQMGPTLFRVFLYEAIGTVSNGLFSLLPVVWLGVPASGSSTRCFRGASRHVKDDTECQIDGRSLWPHAVRSTYLSDSLRPKDLSAAA